MPEDYHTNEIAGTSRHRKRIGSDYSKLNSILGEGRRLCVACNTRHQ